MNHSLSFFFVGLLTAAYPCTAQSQSELGETPALDLHRRAYAVRAIDPIVLDGRLDDTAWVTTPATSDFTQFQPQPDGVPSERTEVRFLYDDYALYVGARMFDQAPDSILRQMSQRDNKGNTDVFGIWFSALNDGVNGVQFTATPQGVQIDEKISGEDVDRAWNAVWDVVCTIDSAGWTAEFRIPWMALRFPDVKEQIWGTNFYRHIRRHREDDVWRAMDPRLEGLVNQGGTLHGIQDISPPARISLFPYLSAYQKIDEEGTTGRDLNGGMDLKLGLGNAFTVDMTLIPDFGQVVADNNILNLSPFEIQFEENRPFFTEGLEMFNKGRIFYSRRIGENANLLNVTKLSGRTAGGTGLGLLQGLARTHSDSSLRSYTVAVVDQNLPNNSYISTTGTLVTNEGDRVDAWAQAIEFNLQDSTNRWGVWGGASLNREIGGIEEDLEEGANPAMEGESFGGGIYQRMDHFSWTVGSFYESEDFNPNALGYLESPNEHSTFVELGYDLYQPFGGFNSMSWSLEARSTRTVLPSAFQGIFIEGRWSMLTRGFNMITLRFEGMPVDGVNPFASRIDGLNWLEPRWWGTGGWISTDYRKRAAVDIGASLARVHLGTTDPGIWPPAVLVEDLIEESERLRARGIRHHTMEMGM